MEGRCNECKYYDKVGPNCGYCRLYPPKINIPRDGYGHVVWEWPRVNDGDWCGQLKFPDAEME